MGTETDRWTGRAAQGLAHPVRTPFVATLAVLAAIAIGLAMGALAGILACLVLALFLALGLDPVVSLLERRGLTRAWGVAIVFVAFALVAVVGIVWVVPAVIGQLVELTDAVPAALEEVRTSTWAENLDPGVAAVLGAALAETAAFLAEPGNVVGLFGGLFGSILVVGAGAVSAISAGVIVVVVTLYFLGSLGSMKATVYRLTAAYARPTVERLTEKITGSIGSFVLGAVILASCNAAIATVLHLVLGLPFPALMGIVAFTVTLVPVIGSVLYWVIASVLALFTDPTSALVFAILYLVYMQLESYVVTPRVMSRATAIPGVLVIIGALVGGTLLGFLGALVAIPVTAAILLIIRDVAMPLQDSKTVPPLRA